MTRHFWEGGKSAPFTCEGENSDEKAVVGIALSRKKDCLLPVNGASFPDANRYSTDF